MSHTHNRVLVTVLAGLAAYQAYPLIRQAWAVPQIAERYVNVRPGQRLEARISTGSDRDVALSDLAPGKCVYVVVYSTTCTASMAASRQWHQEAVDSAQVAEALPPEWTTVWVTAGSLDAARRFLPRGFSFPSGVVATGRTVEDEAGIRAYPAHIILNREGKVVAGDVGAPLLQKSEMHPDCTVVREAGAEPVQFTRRAGTS